MLLPSATKLRRLCFYTCLSVHRGGAWSGGGVWARGVPAPGGGACSRGLVPGPGGCLIWGVSGPSGGTCSGGALSRGGICSVGDWSRGGSAGGPGPKGVCSGGFPECTEVDTPPQQMATVADGTHPTGMHSCFKMATEEDQF